MLPGVTRSAEKKVRMNSLPTFPRARFGREQEKSYFHSSYLPQPQTLQPCVRSQLVNGSQAETFLITCSCEEISSSRLICPLPFIFLVFVPVHRIHLVCENSGLQHASECRWNMLYYALNLKAPKLFSQSSNLKIFSALLLWTKPIACFKCW